MFILSRTIQHTRVKMQRKVLASTCSIVCWFTPHQMKWGMFHTGSVVARYKCNELLKGTLWHIYAQTCALRSSQCRFSMSRLHIYEIHVEYTLKSCCPLQLSNATALAITQWSCLRCMYINFTAVGKASAGVPRNITKDFFRSAISSRLLRISSKVVLSSVYNKTCHKRSGPWFKCIVKSKAPEEEFLNE